MYSRQEARQQDLETNLSSQEEGIISGTATEDPNAAETPAETTPAPEGGWANYDEEFIDSGDEYSYPDTMGNVQDESAAVGNGETSGTGRDTGTADNAGETAASQEAQAAEIKNCACRQELSILCGKYVTVHR
ncbi:MAG: hypothetical protein ACLT76_01350 [Clostridium fessum]